MVFTTDLSGNCGIYSVKKFVHGSKMFEKFTKVFAIILTGTVLIFAAFRKKKVPNY